MEAIQTVLKAKHVPEFDLSSVSTLFDYTERQPLDNLLWSIDGYKPEVCFNIAYNDQCLLLKYWVQEKYVKAVYREINDPVFKDSCVELFIAFDNDDNYYNLEFNCLGTALAGYGSGKNNRIALPASLIKRIKSRHHIKSPGDAAEPLISWELTLSIPFQVFKYQNIKSLKGQTCRVNLYKCGDDLPEPHFLSWNNIINPYPEFHLPGFFGQLKFV